MFGWAIKQESNNCVYGYTVERLYGHTAKTSGGYKVAF